MGALGNNIEDRYESIVAINTEGLTSVYRARHRVLGSVHVLRILRQAAGQPNGLREAFLDRARLQARLRHPAWVRVHNVYEEAGLAVVASDFVEGVALDTHLAAGGALDSVAAAGLVAILAEAVAELHDLGVAHHELRPGLVILEGEARVARITHLSLSLQFTGEGPAVGYASPEELVHPGAGDARADVHALGAMLHHAVSGVAPDPSVRRSDALNRKLGGRGLPPLTNHESLGAIVRAATGDRLGERTHDARALGAVLSRWVQRQEAQGDENVELTLPEPEAGSWASEDEVPASSVPIAPSESTEPLTAPTERAAAAAINGRRPWAFGAMIAGCAAIGAVAMLGVGGFAAYDHWRTSRSAELTEASMSILGRYKTDPGANDDASVLASGLSLATQAVDYSATPRALGVQALAQTWLDGWHLANAKWDADRFRRATASTSVAAAGGSAEGVFARALVLGSACKLLDVSDSSRAGYCAEADSLYQAADASLAHDARTWLRFEVMWTRAAFYNQQALAAAAAGASPDLARRAWAQAMAVCDQGRPLLASSPVNDRELEQECVVASGGTGRYADYFTWARLLQADDLERHSKLTSNNVEVVYRGALPGCSTLRFERNRKKKTVPHVGDSPSYMFCYAAGLRALGCTGQSDIVIGTGATLDPSLPWADILGGGGGVICYLDGT